MKKMSLRLRLTVSMGLIVFLLACVAFYLAVDLPNHVQALAQNAALSRDHAKNTTGASAANTDAGAKASAGVDAGSDAGAELRATELQTAADDICFRALMMAFGFIPLCMGLCLYLAASGANSLAQFMRLTTQIAQSGAQTRNAEPMPADELSGLARSVGALIAQQRAVFERVAALVTDITTMVQRSLAAGHGLTTSSASMQTCVLETTTAAQNMSAVIEEIGRDIGALAESSNQSSVSWIQIGTNNAVVTSIMDTMTSATSTANAAIQDMDRSIGEIAHNIERLNDIILQTASLVNAMTQNIEEVERTSKETARLSERVSSDAEVGVQALQKTLQGIDNIKRASQSAADVIARLGLRIEEIGAILRVIDEVAAQTKLLSLNAAIIASQAGEHGRGFSVVADQIKQLAQRTGSSTREIATLIQSVQQESRKAVNAMALGVTSVDTGVLLGHEAADALEKIRLSAGASTAMIHKIAGAAIDQARNSKEMTQSIERIGQAVGQINTYSQQQARSTEQIAQSSKSMQTFTEKLRHATHEQTENSSQLVQAMQVIHDRVARLKTAQRKQAQSANRVHTGVEDIHKICVTHNLTSTELEHAMTALHHATQSLGIEVKTDTFKL